MKLGPVVALIVLRIPAIRRDSLLGGNGRKLANALLLLRRRRITKLCVCAWQARGAALIECRVLLHGVKRRQRVCGARLVPLAVVHHPEAFARATFGCANERRPLMRTLVPYPHELRIVPAAAVLIHRKLSVRAEPSPILTTARLSLQPARRVVAPAHSDARATAHAERRVECPPELRAFTLRCLLKRCRRR